MTFEEDQAPSRPWLMTLADLALLLVGCFVLIQATDLDRHALAKGIREGFGVSETAMPVDLATAEGFAPGSAQVSDMAGAIAWARAAARDPRTRLVVTGEVDGSAADVDPATGSGALLAADRARAIAARLIQEGAAAPERIQIVTRTGQRRAVLTIGYDGGKR